jgi:hypothetical protein
VQPDLAQMERAATRVLLATCPEAPIDRVIRIFREWLHLPDPGPVEVLLGTVAANRMDADPLWLMMVGPPGSGKTEALQSITGLPAIHSVGTLTEAALLSGTPGRERAHDSKGGLLRVIGSSGLILCKDFGSVLSMHRDTRASLLAALREIYDGTWVRHVGADGGRTLAWTGRVALIAGVTPIVDSYHAVMSTMGERFLLYRMPHSEPGRQAKQAMRHTGHERDMRRELTRVVRDLFDSITLPAVTMPEGEIQDSVIALATLAATGRSAIERDGYSREIELVPDAEVPGRLAIGLARLYGGMRAIGVPDAEAWRLTVKVGLDCIPAIRWAILTVLLTATEPMGTADIGALIRHPTITARRALEDLFAHRMVDKVPGAGRKSDSWAVSPGARELHQTATRCLSEKSLYTSPNPFDDFSDKQRDAEEFDLLGVS